MTPVIYANVRRAWPALSALLFVAGCKREAHPWEQGDAAVPPPPPRTPSSAEISVLPPSSALAPTVGNSAGEPATPVDLEAAGGPPVRVGGPWVRCYGNFKSSGDPVKDVTRLALLCGPENGMVRLGDKRVEGAVGQGAPSVSSAFEARRGECYRVFAVADPGVTDLDVVVRSSRGAPLAADHGEDAWPVVQPDRPFCALEDDRYTVEVSAHRGQGRFAAEIWVLRTPSPRGKTPGRRPSPDPAD